MVKYHQDTYILDLIKLDNCTYPAA